MAKTEWIKAHYDRVALIVAGVFLFISAVSIWWNAIQFGNRLVAEPGAPPKNVSPPPVAADLDRATERLQRPSQWKSSPRSGLFVPEKHFIGANGLPSTLQNTQVHQPVPNDWFEKFGLPIQDPDDSSIILTATDSRIWTSGRGTHPTARIPPGLSHKLHLVSATEEPFRFVFGSWVEDTFALNTIDQSEPTQFLKVENYPGYFKIVKFTEKHERNQYRHQRRCLGIASQTSGHSCAGHVGKGKDRYLAAVRGHFRLYLGRAPGVRSEKRSRIFLETRRRDQLQAHGCAA